MPESDWFRHLLPSQTPNRRDDSSVDETESHAADIKSNCGGTEFVNTEGLSLFYFLLIKM